MSSTKLDTSGVFQPVTVQTGETRLDLPGNAVRIRRNGIEFRTSKSIPTWTEMTVELQLPGSAKQVSSNGVVVACEGNRHSGYLVSIMFLGLSRQTQERLDALAAREFPSSQLA